MPLSKARDKVRKQKERAKSRLDRLLCPPQTLNPVQPEPQDDYELIIATPFFDRDWKPEIDADGNPIPDLT